MANEKKQKKNIVLSHAAGDKEKTVIRKRQGVSRWCPKAFQNPKLLYIFRGNKALSTFRLKLALEAN